MKIHEFQAKQILREHGIPTPQGGVAETPEAAVKIAQGLRLPVVVKAQVHVGGRGKAGGVKLAKTLDEVKRHASAIIGMDIKGSRVNQVLVEEGVDIQGEIYIGFVIDRARKAPVLIASAAGGVEIEVVAAETPEKIHTEVVDPALGLCDYQVRRTMFALGLDRRLSKEGKRTFSYIINALHIAFLSKDCSLAEINPLVVTGGGEVIAADAKMNFDDNALYRHPELAALRDDREEEPLEVEAHRAKVNYVKLDGQIGCIVNGAGLAMGTMDVVKHFGGEPANFLDIGGGAKADQVTEALRIITSDPTVNTILFNIFGGIVRCDRVAEGILEAKRRLSLDLPIVIRLAGTNEEKAREMLAGADLIACQTMSEAAKKAVELSKRAA
ncbi:MAG: ADP-forming succinate--CoA ligase subunit beta [Candidatus Sumerlaeia bacterium]|nr:ADP-forming succinate--CoA ligase subunit beta [Candidatus Sumerlaeia bacterium]